MASKATAAKLQEELSCSICLECFKNPVSIHCGHSFCRACITAYWSMGKKKTFFCPLCNVPSHKKVLKPCKELRNIAEIVQQLNVVEEKGERREKMCSKHQEPLKLFCKDDQVFICVVCDKSKDHQDHTVLPREEAALHYKKQVRDEVKYMRQEKEKLVGFKKTIAGRTTASLKTIQSETQKLEAEFKQVHQFLDEQKQFLLAKWESLRIATLENQEVHIKKLSECISHLDSLTKEVERKSQLPETEFLQEVKNITTRCKKRKFCETMEVSPELGKTLDSLTRQNAAVAQRLQKFEETLLSALRDKKYSHVAPSGTTMQNSSFLPFQKPEEDTQCPPLKRVRKYPIIQSREMYWKKTQRTAECSVTASDCSLDFQTPSASAVPVQPGETDDVEKGHFPSTTGLSFAKIRSMCSQWFT